MFGSRHLSVFRGVGGAVCIVFGLYQEGGTLVIVFLRPQYDPIFDSRYDAIR